jgi:alpha-ribazole phosphatase/probable phosphoglycerate mutase
MPSTRLILIRHGHTRDNGGDPVPRMSGWADCALSVRGHEQVRRLCERLKNEPRFAAIYASTLRRALETAEPLSAAGLGALEPCPGLREIDCGEVDGLPIAYVQHCHGDLWRINMQQEDDDFRWPGGESYAELRARSLETIVEIAQRHSGERIALVTHAGVISQVVGSLLGNRAARWQDHRPENTSLTELAYRGGSLSLERFDDHRHLDGASTPTGIGAANDA